MRPEWPFFDRGDNGCPGAFATGRDGVRFRGKTGSHGQTVKMTRMTDTVEKVENRTKPKILANVDFLDHSAAAMLSSADTKARGRFSEKRSGPSRRYARNASTALENFVCFPKRLFRQYRPTADIGRSPK